MATFVGTESEFNRYVGPRVRNVVNAMTKAAKKEAGFCALCGRSVPELEAAHVHGRERTTIIHELLERYRAGDTYRVDLDSFERELKAAHEPIGETFLFLCPECHRAYDRDGRARSASKPPTSKPASPSRPTDVVVPSGLELAPGETNKSYVTRVFASLYDGGRISESELARLSSEDSASEDYRQRTFGFSRPLYVRSAERRFDFTNHARYYAEPICGGIYLCSQWVSKPDSPSYNLDKFQTWARRMLGAPRP